MRFGKLQPARKAEVVKQERLSTAARDKHVIQCEPRGPVLFGDPAMFCVDESLLQEYLRLELERLSKSDKTLHGRQAS